MFFNKVVVSDTANSKWKALYASKQLTVPRINVRSKNPMIFCIGSCFAEYLKQALEGRAGEVCYPDYRKLALDVHREVADTISTGSFHMNHYSIASIRQEFQRALGLVSEDKFKPIKLEGFRIVNGVREKNSESSIYQDPYRREVLASDQASCRSLSQRINSLVRDGLNKSSVFIVTLGLIEIFKDESGLILNQFPGYMGGGYNSAKSNFHLMTFDEIVSDLRTVVSIVRGVNPHSNIVFSVSPVPLQKTFTTQDVFIANMYSKSMLRAAVNQVVEPDNGVYYFPSYEIASNVGSDFFQDRDLRHAKRGYVDCIVQAFLKSAC
jgi:hypothetical protein